MIPKIGTKGYAPCWPFRMVYDGYGWFDDMNWFVSILFQYVFSLFWDGTIRIKATREKTNGRQDH